MAQTKDSTSRRRRGQSDDSGKLRIGDDWNAIRIIALSQSNPLKAIAEFVENSIDANARRITISRFRQQGEIFIRIDDDGDGVPLDDEGRPNFRYVATHICDSIKRQIKAHGQQGVQGEFGIGLLSFWTVGETLSMICTGDDGKPHEMRMEKGDPRFSVTSRRLVSDGGTRLTVGPLLSGIRGMSGDKLHWYLASELRDRIRKSAVDIRIIDRITRKEYSVEPTEFDGQHLNQLPTPRSPFGDVHVEIYLAESQPNRAPNLYRAGTRVLPRITDLGPFQKSPWNSGFFDGVIDAPFLNLTPGTRLGVIHDDRFQTLVESLVELESALTETIEQQKRIATEQANRDTLKSIRKAFHEALLILPEEEYDWFDILKLDGSRQNRRSTRNRPGNAGSDRQLDSASELASQVREPAYIQSSSNPESSQEALSAETEGNERQKSFYEHPGPLFSARISPTTCTMSVNTTKNFQSAPRDRNRRAVVDQLKYSWSMIEGNAELDSRDRATVTLTAPSEPQLLRLSLTVTQSDGRPHVVGMASTDGAAETVNAGSIATEYDSGSVRTVQAEAIITVTDSLMPERSQTDPRRGMPEYTFEKKPGQLWRSRFDIEANLIVINSGHRDFAYASRNKSLKLRYICRLFGKELILQNFPGLSSEQLLERLIELGLYTEENLR